MDLSLFLYPCYSSFGCSLSHQYSHFRWPTQGTVSPQTMPKTTGRTTTRTPTRRHPLHLLLCKSWLCKHRCFSPCSRPRSTCMHNPKRHRRRGIGWEIFSALSRQSFLLLWSRWMLMIGSSMLIRSCKWCSGTTVRRCCWPLTNFLVLHTSSGMLMWKPMRNLRASTGQSSEPLFMHIMFPKELSS
jgi:hypothetical protein